MTGPTQHEMLFSRLRSPGRSPRRSRLPRQVFLYRIQPAVGCDGQVGGTRAAADPMAVVRALAAGYPDSMGDDEGLPGRPAAVWPRGV